MNDRIQTHDPELNILKSVLEGKSFDGALLRGVKGDYFRDRDYGQAWEYMRNHFVQFGQVPDASTFLIDHPGLKDYITRARAPEPPEFYADKILEAYTRKGVVEKLREAIPKLKGDPEQGIDAIVDVVSEYKLIRNNVEILSLANTGRDRLNAYESATVYGMPFGWDTIDDATLGAHPGDLGIFAARPGSGKTWLMLHSANVVWQADYRVLMVATEVPANKMLQRFDALHLGLDYDLFKKHLLPTEDMEGYKSFLMDEEESKKRFQIVNGTGMTPSGLGSLIDRVKPDIVYIDSVHKLEPDKRYGTERWLKMANLANELKDNVAQRYGVPVITNTHFNRDVGSAFGNSKNLDGGLENVAGGDEWGKVADLVVGISRGQEEISQKVVKLRVIKGRESEDGKTFYTKFDFKRMDFSETEPYYPEQDQEREAKAEEKKMPW